MKTNAGNNGKSGNKGNVRPSYTQGGNAPVRVGSSGKASSKKSSKAKTSKAKSSKKKKSSAGAKALVFVLVLAIIGGAGYYLYSTGFFDQKYEITLADGTLDKVSAKELRDMLTTDSFVDGIIINGTNVSGMSKDQALEVLRPNQPAVPTLDVSLDLDGVVYPLDLSTLPLTSTLDSVVDQAYSYLKITGDEDVNTLLSIYNQRLALSNSPIEYQSAYTLSTDSVGQIVTETLSGATSVAQDAVITGFDPEACVFEYTNSVRGYEIDLDTAVNDVTDMLERGVYEGVIPVTAQVTEPSLTTEMIQNEFGLIASSTSTTTSNSNRNHNISITCDKINGLVLQPGESWSFNDFVQERTAANGYEIAGVIENGQSAQAYGGGICQVSSMIYQSVIKSDLEVIERNPHMWPSTYAEAGTDAAVDWPNQDFKFRNSSDYPIALTAYWDPSTSKITVCIYGHQFPDGQYIVFDGEVLSTHPAGVQYIANPQLPVGQTNSLRAAHDGVTAASYQIWMDADGNEIRRVELQNSWYSTISAQIEVGTLNPDGSQAVLDTATGALTGVVEAPVEETEVAPVDPNAVPVDPAPVDQPAEPAPEAPAA
ncbi:MAG: VanW family protein [Clostridiales bacterium]|nr:VanW family protein [Clostridiales bacterium]